MVENSIYNASSRFQNLNSIKFYRQTNFFDSFLVVEGDTELLLLTKFKDVKCNLIYPLLITGLRNKKEQVIDTIDKLNQDNILGIHGLVDSDYDDFTITKSSIQNLTYTDQHDIETSFFCLDEFFNKFINKFLQRITKKQIINFYKSIYFLGILRCYIEIKKQDPITGTNFYVNFKNLFTTAYLRTNCNNDFSLKYSDIENSVFSSIRSGAIARSTYDMELASYYKQYKNNFWMIVRSHDLENFMIVILKYFISGSGYNSHSEQMISEKIKAFFIQKVNNKIFSKTGIYDSFKEWESNSNNFKLLK
jgi:hypothetical protein